MKKILKEFLNRFEIYVGTFLFCVILVLLTVQVISRYCFGHSFVWTEELAIICYVWMQYLGIAGSVTSRKQLRIDFFIDRMSFKPKRAVLIIGNVITILFCGLTIKPSLQVINILMRGHVTALLTKIPLAVAHSIIPFTMILMIIRLVQESIILSRESEKEMGAAKPTLDLKHFEQLYLESVKNKEGNS